MICLYEQWYNKSGRRLQECSFEMLGWGGNYWRFISAVCTLVELMWKRGAVQSAVLLLSELHCALSLSHRCGLGALKSEYWKRGVPTWKVKTNLNVGRSPRKESHLLDKERTNGRQGQWPVPPEETRETLERIQKYTPSLLHMTALFSLPSVSQKVISNASLCFLCVIPLLILLSRLQSTGIKKGLYIK